MQPGDRRAGQRPPRARDRRSRRRDGARDRPGRHPVSHAEPQQGTGGARAARSGGPQAVPPRDGGNPRRVRESRHHRRGGRGFAARPRRAGLRDRARRRSRHRRRPGRADDRHVSRRPHSYRRRKDPGRAGRRSALARSVAHPARARFRARPAEDRHAAAARRQHDRLARARHTAGRRPAGPVLVPDRADHDAADRLPHHRDQPGDARGHPRQSRPLAALCRRDHRGRAALLPLDRGQGGALRRARTAPNLPRARGAGRRHDLPERHLDLAAARRAERVARDDPGARTRGDAPARLCDRIRLRRPARAASDIGDAAGARPVFRRPDQRHDRIRGGGRAGADRGAQRGAVRLGAPTRSRSTGPTPISAS